MGLLHHGGEFELNGIWVRALPCPMHLGLRTGPLFPMFCTKLEETWSFSKLPRGRKSLRKNYDTLAYVVNCIL